MKYLVAFAQQLFIFLLSAVTLSTPRGSCVSVQTPFCTVLVVHDILCLSPALTRRYVPETATLPARGLLSRGVFGGSRFHNWVNAILPSPLTLPVPPATNRPLRRFRCARPHRWRGSFPPSYCDRDNFPSGYIII